ncbi:MAG: ABC transporter permease [bacterium]
MTLLKTVKLGWPFWTVVCFFGLAALGPVVAPYDPYAFDVTHALQPPSPSHPLGTDQFGRDLLSRMMVGSRSLATISTTATLGCVAVGVVWGLLAAYFGGIRDEILMRAVDIFISIPEILVALILLAALGTEDRNVVVATVIVYSPFVSRLVRSAALVIMEQEYVDAARIAGERARYIIFREVLPNLVPLLAVEAAMRFGFVVLLVASLGFLGFGVQPPTPDWGLIVSESRNYMKSAPWLIVFPAAAISLIVVASNALADKIGESVA